VTRQKVIKLSDLFKFSVQRIVYANGLEKRNWRGISKLELRPTTTSIELYRDDQLLGCWRLSEQQIAQLPPVRDKDGSFICDRSPAFVYYVFGADGCRYRHLYFRQLPDQQFVIGTRSDLGLKWRYRNNALSKKQRKHINPLTNDPFHS
jgi:hypothetical protein